jgi:succinate-acetate transporter protein
MKQLFMVVLLLLVAWLLLNAVLDYAGWPSHAVQLFSGVVGIGLGVSAAIVSVAYSRWLRRQR